MISLKVEKITTQKVSEIVEKQIEEWIHSGSFKPGQKLPSVRELCEMFAVGRSAVRDAITSLKGKGLLEVKQGDGTFVSRWDGTSLFNEIHLLEKKNIKHLFAVRKILESGMAELAALNRQETHLQRINAIITELEQTPTVEGWKLDFDFHTTLAEATGNEILVHLTNTLSTTMKKTIIDCHRLIFSDPLLTKKVFQQHVAIYDAISAKDSDTARIAMLDHLNFVEQLLSNQSLIEEGGSHAAQ